jgi:hypothetical protein
MSEAGTFLRSIGSAALRASSKYRGKSLFSVKSIGVAGGVLPVCLFTDLDTESFLVLTSLHSGAYILAFRPSIL